jgi:chitosanase
MNVTPIQKRLIERIINVFETGKPDGDYAAISIYADGPHDIRQITYGRSQTTEYGKLRKLIARYVAANGTYSADLEPFAELVGSAPLTDDIEFKNYLRKAGREDAVMQRVQDEFFDDEYFKPAKKWCENEGFTSGLAMLVVYDSFIHSGAVLWVIRGRFPEVTPAKGGDERAWIRAYVVARKAWLSTHRREVVRKSAYRTRDLLHEINRGNWDLAITPIRANGVNVA